MVSCHCCIAPQRIHAWEDPSYRFEVLSNLLLGWKAVIAAKKEQATVAAAVSTITLQETMHITINCGCSADSLEPQLETARLYHSTSLMVKVFAAWSGKARQRRRHADILRTARMKKLQTLFRVSDGIGFEQRIRVHDDFHCLQSWCEATCIAKSRRTWFQQQRLTHQLRFYFDRLRHCAKAQRLLRLVEKQRIFDAWRQQMLQRTREFPVSGSIPFLLHCRPSITHSLRHIGITLATTNKKAMFPCPICLHAPSETSASGRELLEVKYETAHSLPLLNHLHF